VFYDSAPDSGYSLDNLAPAPPASLTIQSPATLVWDEADEPDFDYFTVYGSNSGFEPDVLIGRTSETSFDVQDSPHAYYVVTTTDMAGNESGPASYDPLVDVQDHTPQHFALHQNVPNPFNPATAIEYDVPSPGGKVTIEVFDVAGRLVKTLVSSHKSPGSWSVNWDGKDNNGRNVATGIYFYRLSALGFTRTMKMTLLK
jgi:hypothetical protein